MQLAVSPAMHGAHGLHEGAARARATDCFAYLQPDGGWGWSNAGLVVGDGQSLLVDTLFDLHLTAEMLEAMAPRTAAAPIATLVNTHANGDHCYGNELVPGAEIIASTAAAEEMGDVPAGHARRASCTPRARCGELFRQYFGPFDFEGITLTPRPRTFDRRLALDVGGRSVELTEVGPAHTRGDVLVHVPDATDRVHRRHLVHRGHADRVGGPALELARRLRAASGRSTSTRSSPATARSPTRLVSRRCATISTSSQRKPRDATRPGISDLDAARDIALGPLR